MYNQRTKTPPKRPSIAILTTDSPLRKNDIRSLDVTSMLDFLGNSDEAVEDKMSYLIASQLMLSPLEHVHEIKAVMFWMIDIFELYKNKKVCLQVLCCYEKLIIYSEFKTFFIKNFHWKVLLKKHFLSHQGLQSHLFNILWQILPDLSAVDHEIIASKLAYLEVDESMIQLKNILFYISLQEKSLDLRQFTVDLSCLPLIGSGGFAQVRKLTVQDKPLSNNYFSFAIKMPKRKSMHDTSLFLQEMDIHARLDHKHIIKCYGLSFDHENFAMILEYASLGSVRDALSDENVPWSFFLVHNIALSVARAIAYLHSLSIGHGDLKAENILFIGREVKLSDFGCAKRFARDSLEKGQGHGTTKYQPPEFFNSFVSAYSPTAYDVYHFAFLLWELLTHKIAFSDKHNYIELSQHVLNGGREEIPIDIKSSAWGSMINACWAQKYQDRPRAHEIVQSLQKMSL